MRYSKKGGCATLYGDNTLWVPRFPQPALGIQANLAEKHQLDILFFCPYPWALRHIFINQDTGEVAHTRCNRWIASTVGLLYVG